MSQRCRILIWVGFWDYIVTTLPLVLRFSVLHVNLIFIFLVFASSILLSFLAGGTLISELVSTRRAWIFCVMSLSNGSKMFTRVVFVLHFFMVVSMPYIIFLCTVRQLTNKNIVCLVEYYNYVSNRLELGCICRTFCVNGKVLLWWFYFCPDARCQL